MCSRSLIMGDRKGSSITGPQATLAGSSASVPARMLASVAGLDHQSGATQSGLRLLRPPFEGRTQHISRETGDVTIKQGRTVSTAPFPAPV